MSDQTNSDALEGAIAAVHHEKMWTDQEYSLLDPGIRFAVRVLHAYCIDTCQSCQGGDGHAYDHPTVDLIASDDAEGFAAIAVLRRYGLPVCELSIVWNIANGLPYEKLWRITFAKTMEGRANDRPNFVLGARWNAPSATSEES